MVGWSTAACTPVRDRLAAMQHHRQLERFRQDLASGFYETVIEQGQEIIAANESEPPADIAFYALGEAYAHQNYAGRDYDRAYYYFDKLITHFPDSSLAPEAKTYIGLIETISAREREAAALVLRQKPAEETPAAAPATAGPPLPRMVVENHDFEEAVRRNLEILEEAGHHHPADEALYNLGLIYAHIDNPAKDFSKAQTYFHLLTRQFPESALAEEARIWLGLFETIEKIQQIDIEIERQQQMLTR